MAAVGRKMIIANTLGSLALLLVLVMGGFIMDRGENIFLSYHAKKHHSNLIVTEGRIL